MCTSPITLPSNVRYFTPAHKLYNTFPCGHCLECNDKRISDYQTRMYYEFLQCEKFGGISMQITLTYKQNFLPHTIINGQQVSCFSKTDVQKCIRRFQRKIDSSFDAYKVNGHVPFSYIVFSEYGSEGGREHYHILANHYVPDDFNDINITHLKRLWRDSWSIQKKVSPYKVQIISRENGKVKKRYYTRTTKKISIGIVDFSDRDEHGNIIHDNGRIKSTDSITYCSKYLTKDLSFFEAHSQALSKLSDSDKKLYLLLHGPFHLQSLFYGSSLEELVPFEDLLVNKVQMQGKYGIFYKGVPKYNQKHLFYNDIKTTTETDTGLGYTLVHTTHRQELNDLGIEYKCNQLFSTIERQSQEITSNLQTFQNIYNSTDDEQFIHHFDICISHLHSLNTDHIATYNLVLDNLALLSNDNFIDKYFPYYHPLFTNILDSPELIIDTYRKTLLARNDKETFNSLSSSSLQINDIKRIIESDIPHHARPSEYNDIHIFLKHYRILCSLKTHYDNQLEIFKDRQKQNHSLSNFKFYVSNQTPFTT